MREKVLAEQLFTVESKSLMEHSPAICFLLKVGCCITLSRAMN
jgi:hypothetical protein